MRFKACVLAAAIILVGRAAVASSPRACAVSVNVVVHDTASFPANQRAGVFARWKKYLYLMAQVPGWSYAGMGWQSLLSFPRERLDIMPGENAINGSPKDWLFAYEPRSFGRKHHVRIESVTVNRGPRRIIFLAENGTGMSPEARQIESAVITDLLSKARPEDTFALLTAGGPHIALRFGSHRSELLTAARELAKAPPAAAKSEGVRDALLEATKWFHGHNPGDAIFVVTTGLEGKTPGFLATLRDIGTLGLAQKREASFKQVRRAVLSRHIRVFGLQLGQYYVNLRSACPSRLCGETVYPNESTAAEGFGSSTARDELLLLCAASFGEFAHTNTSAEGYKLTAAHLAHVESYAEAMYHAASEYYVLGLSSTSKNLVIGLKPKVQNQFPFSFVFYPPNIPSCSSPSAPRSAKTRSGHKPRS